MAAGSASSAALVRREGVLKTEEASEKSAMHRRGKPTPKGRDPKQFPSDWLASFSEAELKKSADEADKWLQKSKAMFKHAWKGYHEKAWGEDQLDPAKGTHKHVWGDTGLQILDALSTLWLMNMTDEFKEAEDWVDKKLKFDHQGFVSVFELTIRAMGGLASAHSLSGHEVFLKRAQELADKLMPAFKGQTGIPSTQIDLHTGEQKRGWFKGFLLAEAGSSQLEWRYISQQTGDPKYGAAADKSMNQIMVANGGGGLVPWGLGEAPNGKPVLKNHHISFGAMGDSYYEYLLKVWLQTGKTEPVWKDQWKKAMEEMETRLLKRTKNNLTYIAELKDGRILDKMDHLVCFVGGMLILGARQLPQQEVSKSWEKNAAEITRTCYEMYHREPSHLAPEAVQFYPHNDASSDMKHWNKAKFYILRPEAAEAIFYMFYYTGDPKYRRWAGEILEAIEEHTNTTYGYSAVDDVTKEHPKQTDVMETFFLAETMKYLYLTFVPNPRKVIDLDEFVFNTEAHPLRIYRKGAPTLPATSLGVKASESPISDIEMNNKLNGMRRVHKRKKL